MTPVKDLLYLPGGVLLRTGQLLLIISQLALVIFFFRQKRKAATLIPAVLHYLTGFLLFAFLLNLTADVFLDGRPRTDWPWILAIGSLPWLVILCAELISAFLLFFGFRDLLRYRKRQPLPEAVKETVDLLPVGVCFGDPSGEVQLSNLRMNDACRQLTGQDLSDADLLWNAVSAGENQNGRFIIRTERGQTLLFSRKDVRVDQEPKVQITASDITELARVRESLSSQNEKLKDIQYRLKAYQVRAADMLVAQEKLSARIEVHDSLGSLLLHCRYYLENPGAVKEDDLLEMIQRTNRYLLREAEEQAGRRDPFRKALRIAEGIGVQVKTEGRIPEDEELLNILGLAVSECAANTVKHAGGSELQVTIQENPEESEENKAETAGNNPGTGAASDNLRIALTNNGTPPDHPVVETGGLLSLRRKVEEAGGQMTILTEDGFLLILILPQNKTRKRTSTPPATHS